MESIQFTTFPAFPWCSIYYWRKTPPCRTWVGPQVGGRLIPNRQKICVFGLSVEILMIPERNGSGCFCFWVSRRVLESVCVRVCVRILRIFSFSNSDHNPPPHWLRRCPSVLPLFPQAIEIVRHSNGQSGGRKENEWDKHVGGDAWMDGWMDGWEEWVDEVRREQRGSEGGGGGRLKA